MSHRAAIFQLRAQVDPDTGKPPSLQKIADTLGVSKSLVAKELKRPATTAVPEDPGGDPLPLASFQDPELLAASSELAAERAQLQRLELQLKRRNLERQMALLSDPGQGNNAALMMFVETQMRELRGELAALQRRALQPAPAPPPPANELEILEKLQRGWQAVQAIAPQKPPSSAAELELQVAKDRLDLEREERMRRLDADLEDRRKAMENERIRAEAVAEQIRYWGPIIGTGLQHWMTQGGPAGGQEQSGEGAPNPNPAPGPRPGLTVLTPERGPGVTIGMVEGPCPSCGVALGIVPQGRNSEFCPRCRQELVVVNGKIWPKLPPDRAPRFAS